MNNLNRLDNTVHLSFRDILLVPFDNDLCSIKSRNDPDISSEVCPGKKLDIPLVSSPMDSVAGIEMCVELNRLGCLGIYTRSINDPNEFTKQQVAIGNIKSNRENGLGHVAVAVGVRGHTIDHIKSMCDKGLEIVCVDIANGNHVFVAELLTQIAKLKDSYPSLSVVAGNVATGIAARRLAGYGADAIKCGIGSGASCSTRRVVGFGVPQLTAVLDCANSLKDLNVRLISDGGIRHPSDCVKALWAGADVVMAGYIFAGHDECPVIDGKKIYRGMSSFEVSGRQDVAPEGVQITKIESKGPVVNTVSQYAAAIRAACSMGNARNLKELRNNVRAIRVSTSTHEESDPVFG